MTNPVLSKDRLLADTLGIPDMLKAALPGLEAEIINSMAGADVATKKMIVLSGSGDLLHSALSTRSAIERLTGIPTFARPSMQLGLYDSLGVGKDCLVIQMSFSGATARAVEAATLVKQRGCDVWAITGNPSSDLAKVVHRHFRKPPTTENETVGFPITMAMLLLIGAKIGELTGRLTADSAEAFRALLRSSTRDMKSTIEAVRGRAENCAIAIKDAAHVLFLASGPTYGTAVNASARVMEVGGASASAQDIEEWVHHDQWVADKKLPVVLIAPPGPGIDRAQEVSHALKVLGKEQIVITHESCFARFSGASALLPVPSVLPEELLPLVYNLPCELLAEFLCQARGSSPFRSDDPTYAELGEIRWGGHIRSQLPVTQLQAGKAI
jgi:glucosamine--fructose-6-phosphate aminotransferase (isomerizing)